MNSSGNRTSCATAGAASELRMIDGFLVKSTPLSEATIKGYVSRMLDKLHCANRTQAGLIAHDAGIVRT
jgi:hypothetical protein